MQPERLGPCGYPVPLVLIVDDFQIAREMYSEYLEFFGFRTAMAADGFEAVEQAEELHPSVILMDLGIPIMDRWTTIRRLKANRRTRHIPVISVTAHAFPVDEERARTVWASNMITKPTYPYELLTEILRLLDEVGVE